MNVLQHLEAVFEDPLELMRVCVRQLDTHFFDMVFKRFPQNIQFLISEFEAVHIASIVGQAARGHAGDRPPGRQLQAGCQFGDRGAI